MQRAKLYISCSDSWVQLTLGEFLLLFGHWFPVYATGRSKTWHWHLFDDVIRVTIHSIHQRQGSHGPVGLKQPHRDVFAPWISEWYLLGSQYSPPLASLPQAWENPSPAFLTSPQEPWRGWELSKQFPLLSALAHCEQQPLQKQAAVLILVSPWPIDALAQSVFLVMRAGSSCHFLIPSLYLAFLSCLLQLQRTLLRD